MSNKYREIRLKDIAKFNQKNIDKDFAFNEIYYLDTSSITRNNISSYKIIKINNLPSRAKRRIVENTIIYSTVRPNLEHFGILENPMDNIIVSTGFTTIDIIDNNIDPKYLYYCLTKNDITKRLSQIAETNTSAYPSLNPSDIENLVFEIPENIIKQQKIAKVLSDLDKKIDLNNKIIKELETMSKKLYDYWFVQFDFPDANGKPYRSNGGAMICDPILKREIPQGWEIEPIKEWVKDEVGGDWGSDVPKGNLILKVACVRGADINSLNGKTNTEIPIRYINKNNTDKILSVGDIILEISGGSPSQSTGRIAAISEAAISRFTDPLICTNFCKAVTLNDKTFMYNFLYEWERAYNAGILFNFEGKTSGIKNFLYDSFVSSFKIPFPPKALCKKFKNIITDIDNKKHKSLQQNQELAALRDWLLPMLMNGQITIK